MSPLTAEEKARIAEEEKVRLEARQDLKTKGQAEATRVGCVGCLGFIAVLAGLSGLFWLFARPAAFLPWLLGGAVVGVLVAVAQKWPNVSLTYWKVVGVAFAVGGLAYLLIAGGESAPR